ncbi:ferrochelatase [uncultured Sunxiuqinia sp.]|uniref:ferrochelatase n=1 Tax=uncultured Sunxiuqinia sp. TaxID=1573825 RepID=UPI0026116A97|nr:ferrochelatase [uncultured Sunxiuqinia sp.]
MDNSKRTAVLLVNVGTPDEPKVPAVRRYLFEFLNDRRVIDLPLIPQKLLVNLIIVPFRAPKSTKLYEMLWTPEGSPLLVNAEKNREKLQAALGDEFQVFTAMRYQNPHLRKVLREVRDQRFGRMIVIPVFPQYASSTTGTIAQFVSQEVARWNVIPEIRMVSQFYDHPTFIKAFSERIKSYHPEDYDHIVFSYHGLPNRQVDKVHPEIASTKCTCEQAMPAHGKYCYKATCYETTRLLANALNLKQEDYSVSFQSRLTKNWLKPFSDELVIQKAKEGVKRMLFVAPAFVADCLETTIELGVEYQELFEEHGGEKIQLVESLNDHPLWIETLKELILQP